MSSSVHAPAVPNTYTHHNGKQKGAAGGSQGGTAAAVASDAAVSLPVAV